MFFDAVAAVVSFGIAGLVDDTQEGPGRALAPAVLGLGLGALFIIGVSTHQPVWASWLNLLFALAYLGVAISAAGLVPVARAHSR